MQSTQFSRRRARQLLAEYIACTENVIATFGHDSWIMYCHPLTNEDAIRELGSVLYASEADRGTVLRIGTLYRKLRDEIYDALLHQACVGDWETYEEFVEVFGPFPSPDQDLALSLYGVLRLVQDFDKLLKDIGPLILPAEDLPRGELMAIGERVLAMEGGLALIEELLKQRANSNENAERSDRIRAKATRAFAQKLPSLERTIPPEDRTRPLSFRDAARYMGKGTGKDAAEWISAVVKDGTIKCESQTRQMHVFSRQNFPKEVWSQILPR